MISYSRLLIMKGSTVALQLEQPAGFNLHRTVNTSSLIAGIVQTFFCDEKASYYGSN